VRKHQPQQATAGADAKTACEAFIASVRAKADANEMTSRVLTSVIVVVTAAIPLLIVASTEWYEFTLGKLLPALLAAAAAGAAAWMQAGRPNERWKLYRGYQRAAEVERLKFENGISPYDDDQTRSNALAAGVSVFELARVMGTSVRMIERHYGALLDGAGAGIAGRLDLFDAERERASGTRQEADS